MAAPTLSEAAWVDILDPPSPEPWLNQPTLLAIIAVVFLLILVFWYIWRQQPQQSARRQLRRLQKLAMHQSLEPNALLHGIAQALRHGFCTQTLEQIHPPTMQQSQWQQFCRQFRTARFSGGSMTYQDVQKWIRQAKYWLRYVRVHARHK